MRKLQPSELPICIYSTKQLLHVRHTYPQKVYLGCHMPTLHFNSDKAFIFLVDKELRVSFEVFMNITWTHTNLVNTTSNISQVFFAKSREVFQVIAWFLPYSGSLSQVFIFNFLLQGYDSVGEMEHLCCQRLVIVLAWLRKSMMMSTTYLFYDVLNQLPIYNF